MAARQCRSIASSLKRNYCSVGRLLLFAAFRRGVLSKTLLKLPLHPGIDSDDATLIMTKPESHRRGHLLWYVGCGCHWMD
jgi:hypothetical protein